MPITRKQFLCELGLTTRYERLKVGLTQAQLAERLGEKSCSELSKFERGKRNSCIDCYWQIARALKIDEFALLRKLTEEEKQQAELWEAEVRANRQKHRQKKVWKRKKDE